jgi:hypothetical protein
MTPEKPLPHCPEAERALLANEWPSASEAEQRLLDFTAELILEIAHTHPRVTQEHIAAWVARVAVGEKR